MEQPRPAPKAVSAILLVSMAAIAGILWLTYLRNPSSGQGETWAFLSGINAVFNALSASCIIFGIRAIRRKKRDLHRKWMASALLFSSLFLVGYLLHHAMHGDTRFTGEGWIRRVYFFILISHIVLSTVVLPMVLVTVFFALTKRFNGHKRIARFTYPAWLYVSITGVVVFLMLKGYG